MVLDAAGRILEKEGNIEEGASLEGRSLESPFIFMRAVWRVDRMLHMEDDSTQYLSQVVAEQKLEGRKAHLRQEPHPKDDRHYLLEEAPTQNAVALAHHVEKSNEPHEWHSHKEIDNGLSENPSEDSPPSLHLIILFFGEEYGLGEIESIQISEMLMVVVVAVPPCVVGVMLVDAQQFAHDDVHLQRGEEVAVSKVVELHEDAQSVPPVDKPPQETKTQLRDQYP